MGRGCTVILDTEDIGVSQGGGGRLSWASWRLTRVVLVAGELPGSLLAQRGGNQLIEAS